MPQNTVIDSRGREVPLCVAKTLPSEIEPRTRRAVRAAETGGPLFWSRAAVTGLVSSVPAAIIFVATGASPGTTLVVLGAVLLFASLQAFAQWCMGLGRAEEARDALLAARLCASCTYRLDATPPETDGCLVCPECGAAWRPAPRPRV